MLSKLNKPFQLAELLPMAFFESKQLQTYTGAGQGDCKSWIKAMVGKSFWQSKSSADLGSSPRWCNSGRVSLAM